MSGAPKAQMNIMALPQPVRRRPWAAYAVAVLVTAASIGIYGLFDDTLRSFPFLMPVTAVTIVAYLGGRGPAILATFLAGLFVEYTIMSPRYDFALEWPSGYIATFFYLFLCAIIIFLMHGMFVAHAAMLVTEASLQSLNDKLELRVAERTATLLEAQNALRDTNHNLESIVEARVGELRIANEEIQRFAYIVSHDLRAPLVNVLGFTSELDTVRTELEAFIDEAERTAPGLVTAERREAIRTDLPEALGFIRASTSKMDRLINAILKLSREGRRKLVPQSIDLEALILAQGETLAQQLSAKDAVLVVDGALPIVASDLLAIEQIFGNLIENAVKYLAPGRPGRIVVSGRAEGAWLRYDIADNGRGIIAKDFERIFDLFRRSGEQDTPGEGIGLAYVRNLARRLGGNVTVRSEFGVGSTFVVTLPAALPPQAPADMLDGAV